MATEQRQIVDERLDSFYVKNIRCPYCGARIEKFTGACRRCGVTKSQIANASNKKAKQIMKQKSGEKIVRTRYRPRDVTFTSMLLCLLVGFFGVHAFYSGRKIRGWIILSSFILFIIFGLIFFIGTPGQNFTNMHPWRRQFDMRGQPFPTDFIVLIAIGTWVVDFFGVVFGLYKYPVRLADAKVDDPIMKRIEAKRKDKGK